MKQLALSAIRFYQKHLSPRKGFCCAYRAHTGHASCSMLGYRAIQRFGLRKGLAVLRQRFHKCTAAHQRYSVPPTYPQHLKHQAGYCDISCDCTPDIADCTISSCPDISDCVSNSCKASDCDFCADSVSACWPSTTSKADTVYLPPKRNHSDEPDSVHPDGD